MKQKIYYTLYDAECAAMDFVKNNPGSQINRNYSGSYRYGVIDDNSNADEDSRFVQNVGTWSGEMPAIEVIGANGEVIGKFGYWDDEID